MYNEQAEGGHTRAAGHADEVLAGRVEHRQETSGRRDDEHAVAGLEPIDDAGAHLAVALHGDLVVTPVERAGTQRVGPLVLLVWGPIHCDELAGLEVGGVAQGQWEPGGFVDGKVQFKRLQLPSRRDL